MSATPASMLEMVDEADSNSVGGDTVWVQVPLLAPQIQIGEERMVDVTDLLWKQRVFITSMNERQQVRALLRSLYPHMTGIYEILDDGWSEFRTLALLSLMTECSSRHGKRKRSCHRCLSESLSHCAMQQTIQTTKLIFHHYYKEE